MDYSYDNPQRVRSINGHRRGAFRLNDEHIAQTHSELMDRLDDPRGTVTVQTTVEASPERVWAVAGSPAQLFAHQPRFAALTELGLLSEDEGARYVIHRAHEGRVFDRVGEVLVNIPGYQLTVSDIDIADPSVSGHFPSLFTVRVEQDGDDPTRAKLQVSYTTFGLVPALMPAVLLLQLRSIQERAEEALSESR